MKKISLKAVLSAILFCFVSTVSPAQTVIFNEDFSVGSPPTGWTQQTNATDGGWKFGVYSQLQSQSWPIPSHTRMAATNDDACNCDKSSDRLITPPIDLSTVSAAGLEVDIFFGRRQYGGDIESGLIEVSTDGGNSFNVLETLSGEGDWYTLTVDLSGYVGNSDVRIAFTYGDNGGWLYGFAIDNVKVFEPVPYDVTLESIKIDSFVTVSHTAPKTVNIEGTIINNGGTPLNTVKVEWQANGGILYSYTYTGLNIPFLGSYDFFHPDNLQLTQPEMFNLNITISTPNGNQDPYNSDNQIATRVTGLGGQVTKNVLIEEASGAWCGWCPLGAYVLDDLRENYQNVIVTTIHGGDAMEIPDGGTITSNLLGGSYPSGMIDRKLFETFGDPPSLGIGFSSSTTYNNAHWYNFIANEKTELVPVALDMSNSYEPGSRQLTINLTATLLGPFEGDYRVNAYIIEDSVTGTGSQYDQENYLSSQSQTGGASGHFYYTFPATITGFQHMQVVRKMLGGAWGTQGVIPNSVAFLDSFPSFSHQYVTTLDGNWKDKDVTIVAFVQKHDNSNVENRPIINSVQADLNSSASTPYTVTYNPNAVGIESINSAGAEVSIYPNPIVGNTANLYFIKPTSGDFEIKLVDMTGKLVSVENRSLNFENMVSINVADLAVGSYLVSIKSEEYQQVTRFIKVSEK